MDTGWPDGFKRLLSIHMPPNGIAFKDGQHASGLPLASHDLSLFQADTGKPLHAVTEVHLRIKAGESEITAELTMLVDGEGTPLDLSDHGVSYAFDKNGEIASKVFLWTVTEMAVSP